MSKCAYCDEKIRENEHAVHCNSCGSWTHRLCFTDITKRQYLAAKKSGIPLSFVCGDCQYRTAFRTDEETTHTDDADDVCFFDSGSVARTETVVGIEEEERSNVSSTEQISDLDGESITDEDTSEFSELESETSLTGEDEPADVHSSDDEDDAAPEYEIVPLGSSKGKDVLVDSVGYQYTRKPRKTGKTIYWRCVVRNKVQNCRASVIESDGTYTRGTYEHIHEPTSDAALARRITSKVKNVAKANVFQSAADIAEEVVVEELSDKRYPSSLASVANVARAANRHRRRTRPKQPTDLKFNLEMAHIPENFLQADIHLNNERHIILATDCMLTQLAKAKTWYMDGTFKVVQKPFYQLFSIHAFMSQGEVIKQVPLCFVIMSARHEEDYKAVFTVIREKMSRPPRVENIVSDFEKALWKAVEKTFPDVKHRGCAFHWAKAVKKQMESNSGLRHQYKRYGQVYRAMQELLALPYLPAANIEPVFDTKLRCKLEALGFKELSDYIQKTWISSKRWSPRAWSVYKQAIRTNNDCEGWHYRLNNKARKSNLHLYLLIRLLHNESKMVLITMKMISEKKLRSTRKKKSRTKDSRIQKYWRKFEAGKMDVDELLVSCAFKPRLEGRDAD